MLKNKKIRLVILALLLFFICLVILIIKGNTFTYEVRMQNNLTNINDIDIIIDNNNIIEITDKKIEDGILKLKLKSKNKGKTNISISFGEEGSLEVFYVHSFGIITQNLYLGKSNGDIIIPISIVIYLSYILILLIKKYNVNKKENLYDYRNIAYMGIIIFLSITLLGQMFRLINNNGLINSINSLINTASFFSFIIFPLAIVVSILVIISNLFLLKKEGFTWKNMLGIILSFIIIILTLAPDYIYNYNLKHNIINIYNEKSIVTYIYQFFETFVYILLSYLECTLLGTIIIAVRSSRHIPKFDKDYIIILGCMIKKDGTLTPLLKGRVDRALTFARMQKEKNNKDIIFIPSGGKGSNEIISEAQAIKNYLLKKGIDKKNIIIEDKSTNTYENIKNSYNLVKDKKKDIKMAFSTTNYHVFRAGTIAYNQNIKIEGIGSKTKAYFWINAFIREFIATLYSEKKKHFYVIGIIIIMLIILIGLTYISNIH